MSKVVLSDKAINFTQSLDIEDLTCFLIVYSKANTPIDKAQLSAIKKELHRKIRNQDKNLWEG